jgi:LPS sulfotransferase NodH
MTSVSMTDPYRLFKVNGQEYSTLVAEAEIARVIDKMCDTSVFLMGAIVREDPREWPKYLKFALDNSLTMVACVLDFLMAAEKELKGDDTVFFLKLLTIAKSNTDQCVLYFMAKQKG